MSQKVITTYTTAPENYDGFGTKTIAMIGLLDGKPFRQVETPEEHVEWQRNRYGSGMYPAADEAEKAKIVKAPWFQIAVHRPQSRVQQAVITILEHWRDYGALTSGALTDFIEQVLLRPEYGIADREEVVKACFAEAGLATPQSIPEMAREIDAAVQRTTAQITREGLELEMRTKKRQAKAHGESIGLFEQKQGTLL